MDMGNYSGQWAGAMVHALGGKSSDSMCAAINRRGGAVYEVVTMITVTTSS